MAEFTAADVGKLREMTGAGMMDCKKALVETHGNIEAAVDPEILQNSTFRICLRVSEPQDSIAMIGIPDAVNLAR